MGRLSKRKQEEKKRNKKKKKMGGKVFKRFRSRIILKYTPASYEIKDLVDTDLRKILCDPPIARIDHICRGLLYARCWV